MRCFSDFDKVSNEVLSNFLIEMFDLYFFGDYNLTIREFDYAIKNVMGLEGGNVCNLNYRKTCGNYLTVSTDGDLYFCDDNLCNQTPYGNIVKDELKDVFKTKLFKDKIELVRSVDSGCKDCSVYTYCRTGCHRNDIDGQNYFCETYKKFYNHVKDIVYKHKKEVGL